MQVLLIEPDAILARAYTAGLQAEGHAVRWVVGAQTGVMAADEQRPDVVILDPQLARHNGIEFLYEFTSYPEWQHIPVILLSALPPSELEHFSVLGRELQVKAVAAKSATSVAQLCVLVKRVAGKRGQKAAGR